MEELRQQTRDVLDGKPAAPKIFPSQYAFNLFSHNSKAGCSSDLSAHPLYGRPLFFPAVSPLCPICAPPLT
jgi:hypothetical protein